MPLQEAPQFTAASVVRETGSMKNRVKMVLALTGALMLAKDAAAEDRAIAYGGRGCGKLDGGVALPCSGQNYEAFSTTACATGRNYLHPLVVETIVAAYQALEKTDSKRDWQYGDMGWKDGGPFEPHKTHQNGLSADFFVPVVNEEGEPDLVPISVFNKFGYGVDFSDSGVFENLRVDWKAIAAHLVALEQEGKQRGVAVELVILDPGFQKLLLKHAPEAAQFEGRFSRKRAWVRHDEHYHVNFRIPAPYRRKLSCPAAKLGPTPAETPARE